MTGDELEYARAADEILREAMTARAKFPPFNSPHEGYAVLLEECDELWDDVKADRHEPAIAEAIQVGAMALRFVADMRAKGRAELRQREDYGPHGVGGHI